MKTVYITGADRGLGYALTEKYLGEGYHVFAGSFMPEWAQLKHLSQTTDRLTVVPLDVTKEESVQQAANIISRHTDKLDLLINNAAIYINEEREIDIFDTLNFDHMRQLMEANTFGPLRVTQSVLPLILRGSGKQIAAISSEAASIADCWRTKEYGYCMSKTALNMQFAILQNHMREFEVQLLLLHPGWVRSYIHGEFNTEATIEAADSANGLYSVIDNTSYTGKLVYKDYTGENLPW